MLQDWFDLQLFAESGEGTGETGENAQDAAAQTGEDAQDAAAKRKADYLKFKTDFKAEFDAEVQGMIRSRMEKAKKAEKAARQYREKTDAIYEALAVKYDLDPQDIDAIGAKVAQDNSYFEDAALRRGMEPDALRQLTNIERENRALKRERDADAARQQADAHRLRMLQQAAQVRQIYPAFNLEEEMQNEQFAFLADKGVDLQTVFEIVHKEDVIAAAMKYAADQTAAKMQQSAQQNAARPDENMLENQNAVKTGVDIEHLTREQMEAYKKEALRGRKVTFRG